jgi:hypothetical protein
LSSFLEVPVSLVMPKVGAYRLVVPSPGSWDEIATVAELEALGVAPTAGHALYYLGVLAVFVLYLEAQVHSALPAAVGRLFLVGVANSGLVS